MSLDLDLDYIAPELRDLAVPLSALRLDPDNARLHDEANRMQVRDLLIDYGQLLPIVARRGTGTIIKGNCTFEETQFLGRTHIAVVFVDFDATSSTSFAIRDNRAPELGRWNDDQLRELLIQLEEGGAPLDNLGWEAFDIERYLNPPAKVGGGDESFINSLLTTATPGSSDEELEKSTGIAATLAPEDDVRNAKPIKVTPAQRETIDRAVEHMREDTDDEHLSEGRALELALADWLAGI